jgi:chromosome segregation ATPase
MNNPRRVSCRVERDMSEHSTLAWLTVTQTCAALGKSDKSVRRMIARGDLLAEKIKTDKGQEWRIDPESVADQGGQMTGCNGRETSLNWNRRIRENQQADTDVSYLSDGDGILTSLETDTQVARLEGYVARDMELLIRRSIEAAQAPLLERIGQLATEYASLAGQLKAQAAAHTLLMDDLRESRKDRAALRAEIAKLMEAQQALPGAAQAALEQAAVEEAVDKSLVPYLKQVQEVSAEADRVKEENERLKEEIVKTQMEAKQLVARHPQRPWWKLW